MIPPQELVVKPWLNWRTVPRRDGDTDAVAGLSEVLAGKPPTPHPGQPLNILVMSGGGKYGAFTAGVLVGWTAAGTRPTFDVATGISSGAVVATLAFLGPKYDQTADPVHHDPGAPRPVRVAADPTGCHGRGLMTAEPLESSSRGGRRRVHVRPAGRPRRGPAAVHRHRERAHQPGGGLGPRGDRLLRPAGRHPARPQDPARRVFAPGVVGAGRVRRGGERVRYRELHADAGNIVQAFVRTPAGIPPGSNVWVLSAGKNYRDPMKKRPRVFGLVGGAVSNSLYALFRSDLVKLYALCAVTRSQFRLLALPLEFPVTPSAFAFDPEELVRMYWVGYQMAAAVRTAGAKPRPTRCPRETTPPRTGLQFVAP